MTQTRRIIIFIIALIAVTGSVFALMSTIQQRDYYLRGYVDATRTTDVPFRVDNRLGVNADLTQYDTERLRHHLGMMQEANVGWVRQFFVWQGQNTFSSEWDQIIETVAEYPDITLIAVLVGAPFTDYVNQPDAFATFTGEFATRYKDQIDYYQIGNEPNTRKGWNDQPPDVASYTSLLATTYQAIHIVDDDATVMAAALATVTAANTDQISDLTYLSDLYDLGLTEFSDAIAVNAYGFAATPYERDVAADKLNFSRMIALREVMQAHDDAQTPLWLTGWGWNSLPIAPGWETVDQTQQRLFTQQGLQRADEEWPWLGGMILQHWQPDASDDDPVWGFAIIGFEDEPTPLWDHLTQLTPYDSATNGLYPVQSRFASYTGIWTFGEPGADLGWVNDSQVAFSFQSEDIALLVRQGDYVAYLYPYLPESHVNALPHTLDGLPYLALQSDDLTEQVGLVAVSRNLDKQMHQLTVVADELIPDELENRWPLIGFAVGSDNLPNLYNHQVTIASITLAVTLLVSVVSAISLEWARIVPNFSLFRRILAAAINLLINGVSSVAMLLSLFLTLGNRLPSLLRRDVIAIPLLLSITVTIYIDQTGFILTLIGCALLGVVVFNRLELGLMATLFWSPLFLFPVEIASFAFPMAEILLLITASACLLRLIINRDPVWKHTFANVPVLPSNIHSMDILVIAWVFVGFVSLTWTDRLGVATTELRTLIIEPAIFYAILRTLQPDSTILSRLVMALIAAGAMVAGVGIVMWLRGESIIEAEEGARRLASVYGSPNNAALLLGRCVPFVVAGLLLDKNTQRRLFIGGVLFVIGTALLLTQSAGALFVGVPASIMVVVMLIYRRRALLPLSGLVLILFAGLLIATQIPRFERLTDFSQGTNFYRLRVWDSAINIISDYPLTGVGLDQFLYHFRDAYMLPDAWEEPDLSHPHNIILDQWTRLGLTGVIILAGMQLVFWRNMFWRYWRINDGDVMPLAERILLVGAMGSMVSLLAHGLVDNSIYVIDLAYIHVFLLIVSIVNNRTNRRPIDVPVETMV